MSEATCGSAPRMSLRSSGLRCLPWTALIESIVLGDGGSNHTKTLRALVDAGAGVNIADGRGSTPLQLARDRGYREMVAILEKAGAK